MHQTTNPQDENKRNQLDSTRSIKMSHTQILKKAWRNVLSYRTLWILGILIALTTFSLNWYFLATPPTNEDEFHLEGVQIQRRGDETFWQAFKRTMRVELKRVDRELENLFLTEFGIKLKSNIVF